MQTIGNQAGTVYRYSPSNGRADIRDDAILEDMLRHYVNCAHDNWDDYLGESTINIAQRASTGKTPFELNYGFNPHLPIGLSECNVLLLTLRLSFSAAFLRHGPSTGWLRAARSSTLTATARTSHFIGVTGFHSTPKNCALSKVLQSCCLVGLVLFKWLRLLANLLTDSDARWKLHDVFHVSWLAPS